MAFFKENEVRLLYEFYSELFCSMLGLVVSHMCILVHASPSEAVWSFNLLAALQVFIH